MISKQKESPFAKRRGKERGQAQEGTRRLTSAMAGHPGSSSCRQPSVQGFLDLTGSHGRIPSKEYNFRNLLAPKCQDQEGAAVEMEV